MCTAISYKTNDHYFGRNLDLERGFSETVTITPRNYPLYFRNTGNIKQHYAMIGMATVAQNYPLYYDATNECGLSVAGLNFPGNAIYHPLHNGALNLSSFEVIPWILSQCATAREARQKLENANITNVVFSKQFPLTPLHWIIADKDQSIVVEPSADGLRIYDNPIGVLTNNPPFDFHMHHLCNYLNLTRDEPTNRFTSNYHIEPYSRGMGAIGLPGDLSSSSRFIRAAFTKLNSVCRQTEESSVSQFFHILSSVEQQRGCVRIGNEYEITLYSSCCNTSKGIYYYTTYENHQISAVHLHHENIDGEKLVAFPLVSKEGILFQN